MLGIAEPPQNPRESSQNAGDPDQDRRANQLIEEEDSLPSLLPSLLPAAETRRRRGSR